MSTSNPQVSWLFGRGLSISCGLPWSVPKEWSQLPRVEKIDRIKVALRAEMDATGVDGSVIRRLLAMLANNTVAPWRHLFLTTNWDYLLQREVNSLGHTVQPAWAAETHVYHLNGTIEEGNDEHRSPFLLEEDPITQRTTSVEANTAFTRISWNQTFVVVGMSFECEMDKFLLHSLASVEDDLPIGESEWIVINPNKDALTSIAIRLKKALPRSTISPVPMKLESWLNSNTPELQKCGALAF